MAAADVSDEARDDAQRRAHADCEVCGLEACLADCCPTERDGFRTASRAQAPVVHWCCEQRWNAIEGERSVADELVAIVRDAVLVLKRRNSSLDISEADALDRARNAVTGIIGNFNVTRKG